MPDPSPSTLTVLNSNFLQLERRSGGRPQKLFIVENSKNAQRKDGVYAPAGTCNPGI